MSTSIVISIIAIILSGISMGITLYGVLLRALTDKTEEVEHGEETGTGRKT